ncbi:hypothetical protein OG242_15405 [Streptomyces sp. NBC_00727]|uniref:hypothetical protein n=1 Tax=Streptomyces sp. NBC_00727 TaxID=2903675 RepID=UPI003869C769
MVVATAAMLAATAGVPAHAAEECARTDLIATLAPTPGASGSPSPSPSASGSPRAGEMQSPLAGWPAGAGRERPGRSAAEVAREDAREDREQRAEETAPAAVPAFTPDPDDFPGPLPAGRQALDGATVERVQQVSLGAGIALVGLGLGFLALRMRRAR